MTNEPEQDWHDYDYSVLRFVPRVHLGMFWNVGVILHSRTAGFLGIRIRFDRKLIEPFCPASLDLGLVEAHLDAYRRICEGGDDAGPIGLLPQSERFQWLTAPRSAVLQTSDVHPGRTRDPEACLEKLSREIIG